MNNFEYIKSMSIDEFAEWLNKNGNFEDSLWINWFDETYCQKCEDVIGTCSGREMEFAYCELNDDKCRFFEEFDEVPWGKDLIKLWLMEEC